MSLDISSLAALFALSRDAVIGETDGVVRFANPAAKELFGAKEGEPAEAYLPADAVRAASDRFIAAGKVRDRRVTVSVTRQNGLSLYTIPRPESRPASLPDGAAAELATLVMTERMALDRLVEIVGAGSGDAADFTAILYRTHYRIKRLQEHLAMSSLLQQGELPFEPRLLPLEEIVADVCSTARSLSPETGVEFRVDCDGDCRIRGDRHLIEVLLFNLLSNSLLHTKAGGAIRVTLVRTEKTCILGVDDAGDGIPSERLADILPGGTIPSMTDPAAGAGLGLSLARGIAELHGGTLLLESRENVGTRLRISFPLVSPDEFGTLRTPDPVRADGMDLALTELSGALDRSVYTRRMFD